MRSIHPLTVLSLFLLVPASITWAQKVSVSGNVYEKGVVKNTFTTPYGSITTTLPNDIRPGDIISGTVSYQPEGRRENEKNTNRIELLKYSLSLEPKRATGNGEPMAAEALKDVFLLQNKPQAAMHGGAEAAQDVFVTEFTVPAQFAGNHMHLVLRDAQKLIVGESSKPVIDPGSPDFVKLKKTSSQLPGRIFIPDKTIYMSGEPALIYFASAAPSPKSGSMVYLNRTRQKELNAEQLELKLLTRSPRQSVYTIPENYYGPAELVFQDANKRIVASEKIHILDLKASCPKTNLMKGESTVLNVKVNGLKDFPANYLRLTLNNTTISSVQMGRSNHEELIIDPVSMKYSSIRFDYAVQKEKKPSDPKGKDWEQSQGTEFSLQRNITAKQTGNFNIDITLNYPSLVYNDPFRQQLDALKTTEQLNNWLSALGKDLSDNTGAREKIADDFVTIGDRDPEQVKSMISNWSGGHDIGRVKVKFPHATVEAGKSAVQNAISEPGGQPAQYEVIEAALEVARQWAENSGNSQIRNDADSLKNKLLEMQHRVYDLTERLKTLEDMRKLFSDVQKSPIKNMRVSHDPNIPQQQKQDSTKDALTDGLLLLRYMAGNTEGKADSTEGGGTSDALTDGLMLIRYNTEQDALNSEIRLPQMNVTSQANVPYINVYYPRKGSLGNAAKPGQKSWSVNNFRFELDGLPCKNVTKIEAIKLETKALDTKKPRWEYKLLTQKIEFIVPEADVFAFQKWYDNFLFKGRNGMEKQVNGNYSIYNPVGDFILSLSLSNLEPVKVMNLGDGRYQVAINPEKVLVNFNTSLLTDLDPGNMYQPDIKALEDSLRKTKDELEQKKRERDITIDDEIKKAEKRKRDCDEELRKAQQDAAAKKAALEKAKKKKENIENNTGPGKAFADKEAAKKNFGDYEAEYEAARKASDLANINLGELKKKCPELTKALNDLKNRKTVALPAEIEKGEKDIKDLEAELEREKTKAQEENIRIEEEKKKAEEEKRQKTEAEKAAEDAKYKSKAENIYLLQNIYSLGLISSKIWETPGLMDWLPDALEKPAGDAAEELIKTPIPLDAINAIAGIATVVGAKLDPCTAEGSITTIKRLKSMTNSKTNQLYTEDQALDKTERMCELIKKIKAIAAAAKK